jgi:hypothetical protein
LAKIVAQDVAEGNPVLETKGGRSYLLKSEEEGAKVVMVPGADGFYRQCRYPLKFRGRGEEKGGGGWEMEEGKGRKGDGRRGGGLDIGRRMWNWGFIGTSAS